MADVIYIAERFNSVTVALKRREDFLSAEGRRTRRLDDDEFAELLELNDAIAHAKPRTGAEVVALTRFADALSAHIVEVAQGQRESRGVVDISVAHMHARNAVAAFMRAA